MINDHYKKNKLKKIYSYISGQCGHGENEFGSLYCSVVLI